jgi:hypothetical protein
MLWHFKTLNELRYLLFKPSSGDLRSACTASQPAARRDLMIFGEMWTDIARGSLTWLVNVNQYSYYSYYSFVVTYLDYSSLAIFVPSLATIPLLCFFDSQTRTAKMCEKNIWSCVARCCFVLLCVASYTTALDTRTPDTSNAWMHGQLFFPCAG